MAVSAGFLARKVSASSRATLDSPPNVEAWLNAHPNVRDSLVWITFPGYVGSTSTGYANWTARQKAELQKAFEMAWNSQPTGLPEVPTNLLPYLPKNVPATVLKPDDAWAYYVAYVGTSLAVEIGGRVSWSVATYPQDSLRILFDSSWLYIRDPDTNTGYRLIVDNNGYFTFAPPDLIHTFLRNLNILGRPGVQPKLLPTDLSKTLPGRNQAELEKRKAIAKLFDWCRINMLHFPGSLFEMESMMDTWQYHGFAPVARVIGGTISKGYPEKVKHNWTGGCYGTTGFLNCVLRTINIPVKQVAHCGHSLPAFTSQKLYLSHGDDLYSSYSRPAPGTTTLAFPSEELFTSQSQYDEWFGSNPSNKCNNIGRRTSELAVKYLPYEFVKTYCQDKSSGAAHENGAVYQALKNYYTVAQLEALDLWGRLEKKVAEGFSCGG